MQAEAFRKLYPEDFLERFLVKGLRPDGRRLTEPRDVSVEVSPVTDAPGSAIVKIGDTTVITSTELDLVDIDGESVSTGRIEHALDIGPLGAAYNSGIAKARQLVASVSGRVQRTLESVVDGRSLKLSGGGGGVEVEGKAWCVRVKSVCLALDGGLFDATLASAVAALGTLKFPPLQEIDGLNSSLKSAGNNVSPSEVVFKCIPCCTGLVLYKDYTLVDPTEEEESLASAHVSIVLTGEDKFHSMDVAAAGQRVSIDALTMQKCRAIASKRTMERIGKLEEIVGHL